MKIGILFGGKSREREISFAGGRTVYDNLNKSLFEPVPLFVDSYGHFILLDWHYIYKGSIRDFYPPIEHLPNSPHHFQVYLESLGQLSIREQDNLMQEVGQPISTDQLHQYIDFAFLTLHGPYGEDGTIQGILEAQSLPYSGSGIFPSAAAMNKVIQKNMIQHTDFHLPDYESIKRQEWLQTNNQKELFENIQTTISGPLVIKPANQGSSLGVTVLKEPAFETFQKGVNKAFFIYEMTPDEWNGYTKNEKVEFIRDWVDIRIGIGMPVKIGNSVINHPEGFLKHLNEHFESSKESLLIEALNGESEVIIESFIPGKEFSCIVIQDENRQPIALPPTEIIKGETVFDYRSKYLAGLSRKKTPIDLPDNQIKVICRTCEKLFSYYRFNVYARIDGFITPAGKVYLNDPNTTSGMLPSSFFFHQAAEIGLNPSQFLTYIIRTSLAERSATSSHPHLHTRQLDSLDQTIQSAQQKASEKQKIGVMFGGYTAERHISVESGRNIYEKLASSAKYEPIPIFVTGERGQGKHECYLIPINLLLKDNADDIKEKLKQFQQKDILGTIKKKAAPITQKYAYQERVTAPKKISYKQLSELVEGVFNTVHGRPGEDGQIQKNLENYQIPYNGSQPESLAITIDKRKTNQLLKQHDFPVLDQKVVEKEEWQADAHTIIETIEQQFDYPFIAKPIDEGCSAAVKKIINKKQLKAYAQIAFRNEQALPEKDGKKLHLKPKEEFPPQARFLVEEIARKKGAKRLLEITGGLLTHRKEGEQPRYEIFEPSETVASHDILSLEEKFLAGEGQNITPARFCKDEQDNQLISREVRKQLKAVAKILKLEGYARIDAFVRIYKQNKIELLVLEVNALPGMTPATCIFHQAALNEYKPYDFIDKIIEDAFHKQRSIAKT